MPSRPNVHPLRAPSPALSRGRSRLGTLLALVALVASSLPDGAARAAEASYGRVEGDVTLAAGVGAAFASPGPRVAAELRARYLETAGLFATYEDGAVFDSSADPRRLLAFGLELRPLFLFRWLRGHETQRARLDLLVDSFGLELGMTWPSAPGDGFTSHPGVEAGLGLEMPITADATGVWVALHGGLRWSDDAQATGPVRSDDREAYLAVTLAWHQVVATHLVDVGDEAPR
jgi:hypothetical protein